MSALNEQQFPRAFVKGPLYHGTIHDLQGDEVRPGVRSGASSYMDIHKHHGQSKEEVVSASGDENKAWWMGMASSSLHGGGRPRVWVVEPHSDTRIGVEHMDSPVRNAAFDRGDWKKPEDNNEYVAPSYRVRDVEHIPPPSHLAKPGEGKQGTLPLDWSKHTNPKPRGGRPVSDHDANFGDSRDRMASIHRDALREHKQRISEGRFWKPLTPPGQGALFS